ncbi:MAG TPA: HD domain-containing protein [Vicinamibacterales bacterium]|jgi:[protein-PII] uridylyltransferase|nr:HD domain-containing protein [Vicinamibacterales bacterium]
MATSVSSVEAARQQLSAESARGLGGRAALERFSDRVDELLQRLFAGAPAAGCASVLVALGGYGRRQLCLHSDIDVLILFAGPIGPAEEAHVRSILHPLWDSRFSVGHQIRQVEDFSELEADNPEFLLALLDARVVAGEAALLTRIAARVHTPASHASILAALKRLIDERHAPFNDTLYQLEPDVKDAPGALRDLMAARTIAALTDPALLDRGHVDPARLDDAEEFLLRLRSILHAAHRRNRNVMSHDVQEIAARQMGYEGGQPGQQVERMMADYFRHARGVSRSLDRVRQAAPIPVAANIVQSRDGIRFVDTQQADAQPASWLGLFQAAIDTGAPVADAALTWIQQRADQHAPEEFFPSTADRAALLAFLKPRAGLYARLSEMHDCGLLGRMFPEFQAIFCRVVRDFYHKYTVDEHTLLTIRNLERLATRSTPGRERFSALLQDLAHPELLVLSLLFHDVGKWRDDDHASESVRMALQVAERLELTAEATALVEFLIRHHVRMSLVAFRRDTEDPEIVRQLADLVGFEERLKMLCLLTLVDVEAVNPETLTPWREELLWRLYVDTYNHLTLEYGDELIEHQESGLRALVAGRPAGLAEAEIVRFVEGLPRRYLRLFPHDAIYRHVRLSRDIRPDDVHADLERRGSLWELTVVTLDKPFVFSNICGALSSFGMDISRGHAMTNPNGLVLDIFQFTDQERFLELNASGREQFLEVLGAVVSGATDVTERLRAREQSVLYRRRSGVPAVAPVVHADNRSSRRYTILDIVADNALGLLHRVSRVISRHGCDVDLVLISTEGQKAIDVFHITAAGAKLTEPAIAELTADFHRMLEA